MTRCQTVTLKEVAYDVMEQAYMKASSGGALPAHARQIMYAARSAILERSDRDSLNDQYFTQKLLPDFMAEHPELTQGWDVVFDARGHLIEPHSDREKDIPLGTIDVRNYLHRISRHRVDPPDFGVTDGHRYPTRGPRNRFSAVLFVEKEGFFPLFEASKLARRYDVALMSTKGMSNIASRRLIEKLAVPVLVMHDFDADGFKIYGTLRDSTDRYVYTRPVKVIDIGLRLADVKTYNLESETTCHRYSHSKLLEYGATEEEIDYLWSERVELNAFSSGDMIEWVESKLGEHGIKKVVPDRETLKDAYLRAVEVNRVYAAIESVRQETSQCDIEVPDDLEKRVRKVLRDTPDKPWDDVIAELAEDTEPCED